MSYEDSDEEVEKKVLLPPHKIRFSDLEPELQTKAITCKIYIRFSSGAFGRMGCGV